MTHIHIPCCKMQGTLTLRQVVHIITSGISIVKNYSDENKYLSYTLLPVTCLHYRNDGT